ncbi:MULTISPECIES: maleylpyruvate isomerase family mycothiol-dependent enzyme [Streptomyces]|uniref:maleylpyruvate isomerase family mycothiol-dependent enzyme n=1 Tax=Streptomyces TaxID=1883 RepID=UPI00163C6EC2|nr:MULTISPECIES: maleylpyruvate isomerase family mycothiol-dependent enzyme [Streptomyces]MBC2878739.1 maleylpyruvate isomerase family mycothiol-dependent enzyme [Streptomyces sp. TYQ1024]UBI35182.1 maleylpyruvate isomerase family mycothiol-dependent enzyme [Streptomyces mobaraensis]UKW27774.1 maleylpyruvate isomerase family mycothiol-dependent enzyme [Streptomyces sp. TYQ1024]
MDLVAHFRRETRAFEDAVRRAARAGDAPLVPSCPGWTVADLTGHLGWVHRFVARIVRDRLQDAPEHLDTTFLDLPADRAGWPDPERPPTHGPVPASLVDWYAAGAAALASRFAERDPADSVWTWSADRTTGFWLWAQTFEAAVHRWDAENALGAAEPFDAELAAGGVGWFLGTVVPAWRARGRAAPGAGERFGFRRTDGEGHWTVHFDGDTVRYAPGPGPSDVELSGSASDLTLFLWRRIAAKGLAGVEGDLALLDRWAALVPTV